MEIKRIELETYPKLCKDIPLLEAEIRNMKEGDNGLGNDTVFDYRTGYPRPQPVIGFNWELYEKRQAQLERMKQRKARIETWIEEIDDVTTRNVIKYKYQQEKEWLEIAKLIGHPGDESYPRKMIRDKYFREKNIK